MGFVSKVVGGYLAFEKGAAQKLEKLFHPSRRYGILVTANVPAWPGLSRFVEGILRDPLAPIRIPLGPVTGEFSSHLKGLGARLKDEKGHILCWSAQEDAERAIGVVRAELLRLGFKGEELEIQLFGDELGIDPKD